MSYSPETPFDSIESAQEYLDLLLEAVEDARREVSADIAVAEKNQAERRREALRLVDHNLSKLSVHVAKSRRILNDLRTLRRLLLEERMPPASEVRSKAAGAA